jgi:hypothetical protein
LGLSPRGWGFAPPFIDQGGGGADYMCAALSSYVGKHDVLCCRVGGRPDDPRSRGGSTLGRAGAVAPAKSGIAQVLPFFSDEIRTPKAPLSAAMAAACC